MLSIYVVVLMVAFGGIFKDLSGDPQASAPRLPGQTRLYPPPPPRNYPSRLRCRHLPQVFTAYDWTLRALGSLLVIYMQRVIRGILVRKFALGYSKQTYLDSMRDLLYQQYVLVRLYQAAVGEKINSGGVAGPLFGGLCLLVWRHFGPRIDSGCGPSPIHNLLFYCWHSPVTQRTPSCLCSRVPAPPAQAAGGAGQVAAGAPAAAQGAGEPGSGAQEEHLPEERREASGHGAGRCYPGP